jgi:hypothetical protein
MYAYIFSCNVCNAHKVIIASLTVNDRFGGFVHLQVESLIGNKTPSKASCFYLW